jgi:hypothetical protein
MAVIFSENPEKQEQGAEKETGNHCKREGEAAPDPGPEGDGAFGYEPHLAIRREPSQIARLSGDDGFLGHWKSYRDDLRPEPFPESGRLQLEGAAGGADRMIAIGAERPGELSAESQGVSAGHRNLRRLVRLPAIAKPWQGGHNDEAEEEDETGCHPSRYLEAGENAA